MSNEVLKKTGLDRLVDRIFNHLQDNYFSRFGGNIEGDVSIDGQLSVTKDIQSTNGGVSAKGIADLGQINGGGGSALEVVLDNNLSDTHSENSQQVPSAYSVKRIRDVINIDDLPEFSPDEDYGRGRVVKYNGKAYRFFYNHSAGGWASGDVEPVNITTLSTPLSITENDLMNILK